MQDLFDIGFSVQNSGVQNREIFQKAVDCIVPPYRPCRKI